MTWFYGFAGIAIGVYAISVVGEFVADVVDVFLRNGLAGFRGPRVLPWVARQLFWPTLAVPAGGSGAAGTMDRISAQAKHYGSRTHRSDADPVLAEEEPLR